MSAHVSTVAGPDGRRLASKQGATAHEARLLGSAQHPGVVELVDYDGDAATLHTVFAGSHSLATVGPLDPGRVAVIVAGLAATLADLHALGIVHGRIEPSHVVLGPGGRPLLCGFAGAGVLGTVVPPSTTVPADFADPASAPGSPLDPGADVFGVGALIRFLLTDHGVGLGVGVGLGLGGGHARARHDGRRLSRGRRPWAGWQTASLRRALLNLADQATADDRHRRPTAHDIAAAVATAAPDGERAAGRARAREGQRRAARPAATGPYRAPGGPWLVALAGIAVLLVGLVSLRERDGGSPPGAAPRTPAPTPGATADAGAPTERAGPASTAPHPESSLTTSAPGEGRGRDAAATTVAAGGQRYAVGELGDRTIVGDWDCDGTDTVALLRPRTGEVFVFSGWATAGHDLTVPATQRVDGARRLLADDGDGCDRLLAERHDGAAVEVTT